MSMDTYQESRLSDVLPETAVPVCHYFVLRDSIVNHIVQKRSSNRDRLVQTLQGTFESVWGYVV
jgi:hypothetical protein